MNISDTLVVQQFNYFIILVILYEEYIKSTFIFNCFFKNLISFTVG